MKSLRARIFALVAAVTLLVWSSAAVWTYFSARADVQRVLDRRLVEAARMVGSLVGDLEQSGLANQNVRAPSPTGVYDRQLSCQIWSLDGRLIGRSSEAPAQPLSTVASGFSERLVDGETWRVYTLGDPARGIRILVGDNLSVRQRLVGDLMTGLLLPSLLGIAALALLIWAAVSRGLTPLREIARRLHDRDPGDSSPLGISTGVSELRPVVASVDGLFDRLERLRANEKHFIASAAHELQTPLAGLRTHAQIALMSDDEAVREKSLRRIQTSVDRTSRLVRQLLDLAREESPLHSDPAWVPLAEVVGAIADELAPAVERADVTIRLLPQAHYAELFVDEASLTLALRNLIENAVNHSPPAGTVEVNAQFSDGKACVEVLDGGTGISPQEIHDVKGRFVRGSREKSHGSGLGLSIVELIATRLDGSVELANRAGGGLRANISLPAGRLKFAGEPIEQATAGSISST